MNEPNVLSAIISVCKEQDKKEVLRHDVLSHQTLYPGILKEKGETRKRYMRWFASQLRSLKKKEYVELTRLTVTVTEKGLYKHARR